MSPGRRRREVCGRHFCGGLAVGSFLFAGLIPNSSIGRVYFSFCPSFFCFILSVFYFVAEIEIVSGRSGFIIVGSGVFLS